MEITSLQNSKVKYWVSLHDKKTRDQEHVFLIEGDHLISMAKSNNLILETISTSDTNADYLVTKDIMKKISSQASISDNAAVCKMKEESDISGKLLILDKIQDPGNLGTIIRSALAFGFDNIILSDDSVDLYNDKVIRSTEGAIFDVNVIRRNLLLYIKELKQKGYKIIGTDVINGNNINDIKVDNMALIIGSEGSGMKEELKSLCDSFAYIKISEKIESLNAAVAASILMYEVSNE